MSKKILSVFVALMMVVSMFAMTANAAYYYESEEDLASETPPTQEWALSEPVDNDDGTWSVDVLLTTNYATGPIQFVVTNTDTSVAAIKDVIVGDAITYTNTALFSEAKGKVMLVPDSSLTGTIEATEIDGVIATIVYTYSGSGSATIAIDNNPKSETNPGGTLIAARMSNGNAVTGDSITGQVVLSTGESKVIGGGAAPTLAVIEDTIGVIDTDRTQMGYVDEPTDITGYIYGVEPENFETVDAVFEVIGDGEMQIVANDAGSEAGTGTIVNVVDTDGNIVETYVLVIFGDVNGDGAVDGLDSADLATHDNYMFGINPDTYDDIFGYGGRLPLEAEFAGDINIDYSADGLDSADIATHDNYMFGINPDTYDDVYGCEGRILQSYIISNL